MAGDNALESSLLADFLKSSPSNPYKAKNFWSKPKNLSEDEETVLCPSQKGVPRKFTKRKYGVSIIHLERPFGPSLDP
jgi:hypothetical protein